MRRGFGFWRNVFAGALVAAMCCACASSHTMQPFSTDGCSLFPDRSLIGNADWCGCCVAHDLAYWRGGTAEARLDADRELKDCVLRATRNKALADLMFTGVRAGGGPYFFTPYRWGYGWPFGRLYEPLTDDEQKLASKLEREYLAKDPLLSCPNRTNAKLP